MLGQVAPNKIDPFLSQNNFFGSQKRSESIKESCLNDVARPMVSYPVGEAETNFRRSNSSGHQTTMIGTKD